MEYIKSSINVIDRFCDFKWNDVQEQFYHRLNDVNKFLHRYNKTLNLTLFKDLLYK